MMDRTALNASNMSEVSKFFLKECLAFGVKYEFITVDMVVRLIPFVHGHTRLIVSSNCLTPHKCFNSFILS